MARKTAEREPMRLWAVHMESGAIVAPSSSAGVAARAAETLGGLPIEFVEVHQPSPRDTAWGEGQFDYVTLGPGVQASLRITRDGRVKLTIPGGELDVTDGDCTLGLGLLEASKRAAQVRERMKERARRRAEKTAKP